MNKLLFDKPMHIDEVKERYDFGKVSVLTTPNIFPLVNGIEYSEKDFNLMKSRKTSYPIGKKMDRRIELYDNDLRRVWNEARIKLQRIKKAMKFFAKMDYSNTQTIDEIAKLPPKYKVQFAELANKYDIDLSMLNSIVLNPSLVVNARYDSKNNLIEVNPDYLKQHGMIRVGDSEEYMSEVNKTFIHELGHSFWYQKLTEEQRMEWSALSKFFTRDELEGDLSQYLVGEKKKFDGSTSYSPYYTLRDDKFVSVYARYGMREDFAESFLYYKTSPATLKRISPDKFGFIEKVIVPKMEKKIKKQDVGDYIEEQFEPDIENPKNVRDKIVAILLALGDGLSATAKEHYEAAFNLGKIKGGYYTGQELFDISKLTVKEKEALQKLYQRNDGYLDSFVDDLVDDFDSALFVMTGNEVVGSIKPYEDVEAFDEEFDSIMDSQEHRLGLYATTGASLAMMMGLKIMTDDFYVGGFWHTVGDDKVCSGCDSLDGQWMTYDYFLENHGNTECDGNCRCGDLFEPALAPEGGFELMVKGGEGSGHFGHAGIPGHQGGSTTEGGTLDITKESFLKQKYVTRELKADYSRFLFGLKTKHMEPSVAAYASLVYKAIGKEEPPLNNALFENQSVKKDFLKQKEDAKDEILGNIIDQHQKIQDEIQAAMEPTHNNEDQWKAQREVERKYYPVAENVVLDFLKQKYEDTQAKLKEEGYKSTVTVYRGITDAIPAKGATEHILNNFKISNDRKETTIDDIRSLSSIVSYSKDSSVARYFAGEKADANGLVYEVKIPRSSIIAAAGVTPGIASYDYDSKMKEQPIFAIQTGEEKIKMQDWFGEDIEKEDKKLNKGGQGSGNFGHAGRKGEVGGSAKEGEASGSDSGQKFLKGDRKAFIKDLNEARKATFEKSHDMQMGIFFGVDWIGQDQSGTILSLNKMVAEKYGSTVSDKDITEVFSKMRPGINPAYALMIMNIGMIGIGSDGQPEDKSKKFFDAILKEKEFSEKQFKKVFGDSVEVYKGVSAKYSATIEENTNGFKVKDMPLSSYTIDKNVAIEFAGPGGYLLSRTISADEAWFGVHSHEDFNHKYGTRENGEGEIVVGNKEPYTHFSPAQVKAVH